MAEGDGVDRELLRQLYKEFEEESKRIEEEQANCPHPGRQLKFNGGNPIWLCSECGVFMRYAKFRLPDQGSAFWD